MKLAGAAFPGALRRPLRQHPPGAVAVVPRHARPARRPRVRRQGHRRARCSSSTPGSTPARSSRRSAVPVLDDDDEATLHERIKVVERAMLVESVGRMVRAGLDRQRQEGHHPVSEQLRETRRPIRRALVSVYDKTGLDELAAACTPPASRSSRPARPRPGSLRPGVPVTAVEELTGFPECLDGRVKTLHPKVHAGMLADLRKPDHVAAARRARHRAVRPGRRQPLPVRRDRRLRAPRPTSASSRSTSAARRWSARRPRTTPSVAVVVSPDRYDEVLGAVAAGGFTLAERQRCAGRRGLRPHRGVRRGGRVLDGQRARRPADDGSVFPDVGRRDLGPRGGAALRREPAPAGRALRGSRRARAGPGGAAARQGDVLQQLRRRRRRPARGLRLRRADRRDHQARQPVRHRGRRRTSRTRTARPTPATRCRRSAA